MTKRKLRIGILIDSAMLDAWAFRMLQIIGKSEYAEIVLVVQNSEGRINGSDKSFARHSPGRVIRATVGRILSLIESIVVVGRPGSPDAFETVDSSEILANVERLIVKPRQTKFSDFIDETDLLKIRIKDLDVLLRLGFRVLRGGILQAARHGVWSLHHGDNRINRGGPPGYWEVMESIGETGSVLQILTEDLDNGRVIYRSFSATNDASISANKNNYYWKSLFLAPRRLNDLYTMGSDAFYATFCQPSIVPQLYDRSLYRSPDAAERLTLLCRKLAQKLQRKYSKWRFYDQWTLFYSFADDISTVLWRFKALVPPKDRIWADPFAVVHSGKHFIFFEEMPNSTRKGHISVIEVSRNGQTTPAKIALDAPYHLSYPFVFEYDGQIYMVPESVANRTIELYKCTRFPDQWTFQKNLMQDCEAADATLFEWGGKWWMFANMREIRGVSRWDELFLFYADSPLSSQWTPHPRNPVVSDVKSSRPAGRIFMRDGRIIRPSQNSSNHYGYGFNFCEIMKLTEVEYEERVIQRVEPKWRKDLVSTHTFNYAEGLTVIDAQVRRKR